MPWASPATGKAVRLSGDAAQSRADPCGSASTSKTRLFLARASASAPVDGQRGLADAALLIEKSYIIYIFQKSA